MLTGLYVFFFVELIQNTDASYFPIHIHINTPMAI